MNKVFNVASLFAGVGGICLGMKNAKYRNSIFDIKWANEIDHYANTTYKANFNHPLLEGDIKSLLNPSNNIKNQEYYENLNNYIKTINIDVLNGGFPCQAFSIAGERKGFNDERGNLFWNIIEMIKLLNNPRIVFLENVKGLKTHDNGKTFSIIESELKNLNYTIKTQVINTMDYSNLPQTRERIYIVCFKNETDTNKFKLFDELYKYKNSESKIELTKQIINIDEKVAEKYYYTKDKYPKYFKNKISLEDEINQYYQYYQIRRGMYIRKNKNNVCPTLTANMGTGGHNVPLIKDKFGIRKLTPLETFKLQGFPINYILPVSDANLYKQVGNAVSIPIITLISNELLKVLSD